MCITDSNLWKLGNVVSIMDQERHASLSREAVRIVL